MQRRPPVITIAGHRLRLADQPVVRRAAGRRTSSGSMSTYKYQDNKIYVPSAHFADGSPALPQLRWATTAASAASPGRRRARTRSASTSRSSSTASSTTASTPTRSSTPEASTDAFGGGWIPQVRWTRAQSNKLLFEAGIAYYNQPYEQNCRRGPDADRAAEPERLDRPADGRVRLLDSAVLEHDRRTTTSWRRPATSPARTR